MVATAPSGPLRPRLNHPERLGNHVVQSGSNAHCASIVGPSQCQGRREAVLGMLALAAALQAKASPAVADEVALPVVTDQVWPVVSGQLRAVLVLLLCCPRFPARPDGGQQ